MPDRRFYVYLHKKKSDGEIFYVGKGTVKGLAEFLGLKESQLCDITRKGKMKSHGWRNLGV